MYLLNDDNRIVKYDLELNNRSEIMKLCKDLALKSITVDKYTKSTSEYKKLADMGACQSISNPVYDGEKINDSVLITEYRSKTPYTLAMVAYYAKNNWIQSLYSSIDFMDKAYYVKILVERMMSGYMAMPQLYMTKCHFDGDSYRKHDRLFEALKKDKYALEFMIQEYYPDLKAFMNLFPYIDFVEEEVYRDNYFSEKSFEQSSAIANSDTMKQLGLIPNIRH